jgi:hypothetical protein
MGSFTAIAGWAADVPAELLAQLYSRCCEPPSKATIWRVVTGADAAAVDAAIGAWLAEQATARPSGGPESTTAGESDRASGLVAIAVDGKTVRGATDAQGNQVHLLAAATHHNTLVLGQVEVGAKSNEIPLFAPLLDSLADTGVDLNHPGFGRDSLLGSGDQADQVAQLVQGLELDRWPASAGSVQSMVVIPIHPRRGGDVDFLNSMPRPARFNQLGLVQAY